MAKDFIRWQTENLKQALKMRRVVVVSGARQAGKTTLLRQALSKTGEYRSLDDTDMLNFALSDPKGFVINTSGTMATDEIQKCPKLIPEIKQVVDVNKRAGQYLLTGSANILTLPAISDSLAGRVKYMRLRTLAVGEVLGKKPDFLNCAFKKEFPSRITGYNKADMIDLAFRGGYPEAVALNNPQQRRDWHIDYIKTLIERDLKDISNIRRLGALQSLARVLASWSAKFMAVSQITSAMAINKITLDSYINTLISMFVFEKVEPWLKTDYERVGKRPKFYATDTGLMTSMLGWKQEEVFSNVDRSGKLMETFVFQELAAQIDLGNDYTLFQYRDRVDREIDFIVEREDGALLGIEVKAGHNVSSEDFSAQRWFEENIVRHEKTYTGLVLYSGDRVIPFGKNMMAVPIAALWEKG